MNRKWKKTLVWLFSILILSVPLITMATEQWISNKNLGNKNTSVEQTLLEDWGLTPEMTVSQLKEFAQKYLNEHYSGIQVDSVEFHRLVTKMFNGDTYPLTQMVKDDPAFGPLYLYMCIYYDENYNEDYDENLENPLLHSAKLNNLDKTLKQVIEDDVNGK